MTRMRILVCTNAYPPRFVGGAELVAHQVARQMVLLGHTVVIFAGDLDSPGEHYSVTVDAVDGIAVYRVATRTVDHDPNHRNYVHTDIDARFASIIQQFQPTIVHAHNLIGLSVRMLILAAQSGARVFVTLHDFWGFCLRNTLLLENGTPCVDPNACVACVRGPAFTEWSLRVRRDVMALAFDHVDGFIAPTQYLADQYIAAGFPADRVQVVPNGVDIAPFVEAETAAPARAAGEVVLLYAGYFGAHKGLLVLIRALARTQARPRIRLDLVGEGPLDIALRALVDQSGLADQVRFRGKIQPAAMPRIYATCDIVVLPSLWPENQPVSLMEAMACARPVVASRIGGIPDMIEDGCEGVLVDPDNIQALADALDRLVADPALRARMGENGRRRVQSYGYAQQAETLAERFTQADARPTPAGPIVAILGAEWHAPDAGAMRALASKHGYAIPFAWLTARQRGRVVAFLLIRPTNGWWAFARWLFGPVVAVRHIPRALVRAMLWCDTA